jgi:thiamine transporter ThiT
MITIMKTKFFKFVLPVAFVALGLAGAFSTNAKEMAGSGATIGYQKINAVTCQVTATTCNDTHTFLCKGPGGVQLYRQDAPNDCPEMLWRSFQ